MKIRAVYEELCRRFPLETACSFDNPGLLVGDARAELTGTVIALDCTEAVIDAAVQQGANLIVTHHPVIFDGLKSVTAGSTVYRLIRCGISVICLHTNLDTAAGGVNDCLAKALGLTGIRSLSDETGFTWRIGELTEAMSADDFAAYVGFRLDTAVKYVGENTVRTVAVCSGSGAAFWEASLSAGADALVTADVKHHVFLQAEACGKTLLDAGHFPTEDVVVEPLCAWLREVFPSEVFTTCHESGIKIAVNI